MYKYRNTEIRLKYTVRSQNWVFIRRHMISLGYLVPCCEMSFDVTRCQHLMWTCQHFRSPLNIFSESYSSSIQDLSTYGHDREDKDRRKFRFCKFLFGRFSSFCRSLTRFFRSPDGRISRSGFSFRKFWISFNWRSRFSTFSILLRLIGFGPFTDRILSGLNRGASKNED